MAIKKWQSVRKAFVFVAPFSAFIHDRFEVRHKILVDIGSDLHN
jgi:hypothetical protein